MLKSKSLEDIDRLGNDELFAELTPKESAVIEGGRVLELNKVEHQDAPASAGGAAAFTDVCLTLNNQFLWQGETFTEPGVEDYLGSQTFSGRGIIRLYGSKKCGCNYLGRLRIPKNKTGDIRDTIKVADGTSYLLDVYAS